MVAHVQRSSELPLLSSLWLFMSVYWHYVVIALVIIRYFKQRYLSPLRRFPGPLLASGSRIWKIWSTAYGHTEHDHIELHRKYGMSPDVLC